MDNSVASIGPQVRMMLPELTPKEAEVTRFLLKQGAAVAQLTISEVAGKFEVSEAMIVKLAKRLGFAGYRDLKAKLNQYALLPTAEMFEELSASDTTEQIVNKLFRTSMQALEETLAVLDLEDVERAVKLLLAARQVDLYGLGGSAAIAKDASHKFLRIGSRMSAYEDAHLMSMSASLLTPQDVVIAISHSGQTSAVLSALRLAQANGAKVVALTNHLLSPLGKEADVVLQSTARGSSLMGENAAARIAQLNVIDVLFVCTAQHRSEQAWSNLEKTMRSVEGKRE